MFVSDYVVGPSVLSLTSKMAAWASCEADVTTLSASLNSWTEESLFDCLYGSITGTLPTSQSNTEHSALFPHTRTSNCRPFWICVCLTGGILCAAFDWRPGFGWCVFCVCVCAFPTIAECFCVNSCIQSLKLWLWFCDGLKEPRQTQIDNRGAEHNIQGEIMVGEGVAKKGKQVWPPFKSKFHSALFV